MIKSESIPTLEDWQAIQGGKPRIFESASKKSFKILHIYGAEFNPELAQELPHYGYELPTIGKNMKDSLENPTKIEFLNSKLEVPEVRRITVPAALLIQFHGSPCMQRTVDNKGVNAGYDKLTTSEDLDFYLQKLEHDGYTEQRLGVDPNSNGFRLLPMVRVEKTA